MKHQSALSGGVHMPHPHSSRAPIWTKKSKLAEWDVGSLAILAVLFLWVVFGLAMPYVFNHQASPMVVSTVLDDTYLGIS